MINRTFSSVAVVIALGILTPIQLNAFGLGKLELSSALNEPFKATIPVTALREDEEGNLQVRLATSDEFARAGIERSYYLTKLVFNVIEHPGGATIEVTSLQPIKEPFVDFLLTATTGEGRLIREYTVLLDPPKSIFARPATVVTPSPTNTTRPQSSNKTTYQYPDSNYQAPATSYYSANSYGPTKRDDTLWDIALATKPASASVHQMMLALLDANPTAFIRSNINNLKIGYTLTVPSLDEITKLSNRQAVARVAEQYQQWKDANNVAVVAVQTESNNTESDGQHSANDQPADIANTDARLQLVVEHDDTTMGSDDLSPLGSDSLTKLRDQLTLAQETIEGQEQENIDFKARMDAMEEQLEILRRIIMLKDSDLARLQGMLGEEENVELASDDLSEEMQDVLQQADAENIVNDLPATIEEVETESAMDEFVDEISQADEEMNVDTSMSDAVVQIGSLPARMLDEEAVAAAAQSARAEAEFSGSHIFVEADPVLSVAIDEAGFDANMDVSASIGEDFLQEFRMLDEDAVAAAAEAARAESAFKGDKLFSDIEIGTPMQEQEMDNSFDEMSESIDEMEEEVLPYPEINAVEELAVEDESQLGFAEKIKAFIATNKTIFLGGLGALFLGLLGWLFARRRNQDEEYEWVDTGSVDGASEVELSNVDATVATESEGQAEDESSEILIDPAEEIDDLLKQAEMSIAYGEFDDAHAAVERARVQDPSSQAVALKLVALAYHQKQAEEFNRLIADIDLDKDSAEWQEIVAWGEELAPENELLVEEVTEVPALIADSLDVTKLEETLESEEVSIESDDADSVLEFNLDEPLEAPAQDQIKENAEDEQNLSFDTDFDLEDTSSNDDDLEIDAPFSFDIETDDSTELTEDNDLLENATELVLDDAELPELSSETDELVEINLDDIATDTTEELAEVTTEIDAEKLEELDIGTDDLEFDIGDFDEVDEAETKLDLAAAYVDMGDPDGAKNILNEVLQEGNDEQKSRAQDLLNNLK
ncbi:MAG: hypothetical protein COA83_02485 [Methylophaga sp.]|nr:MAG: hypothetical protein COA83_02485 [Methylophaga sp.]